MTRADQDSLDVEGSNVSANPADGRPDDEVVLWLRVTRGEPLTGSIGEQAQTASFSFHGWIDFMGAINALRHPADTPGPT